MIKNESRARASDAFSSLSRPATEELTPRMNDRRALDSTLGSSVTDESLVVDDRTGLRPAQAVENKLSRLLEEAVMPISHLQMRGMLRAR